jgi:Uma2 family endonuclease
MSATTTTPLWPPTSRAPLRWLVDEFHQMGSCGIFLGHRVMLINGCILETHHGDPHSPDPRPFRWTRDLYHKLGQSGVLKGRRVELVGGEVVPMSPKGWPHVVSCRKTGDLLERVFASGAWVARQEPVALAGQEPEPDVAVFPGRFEDYTDIPTAALLLVEVSDTTFDYDTTTKAELYAAGGITDYWVVDVTGNQLLIFRDPAPVAAGGHAYRTHLVFGPADAVAPLAVPAAAVKVADLLP